MKKTHLSKAITFFSLVLLVSIAHAQANDATTPTEQEHSISKVRIVRLSQVKGSVQIARSSDRSGLDGDHDLDFPGELAQHSDRLPLDSIVRPDIADRSEPARRDDQYHDAGRVGAGGRHSC